MKFRLISPAVIATTIAISSIYLLPPSSAHAGSLCTSIWQHLNPFKQCYYTDFKNAPIQSQKPAPSTGAPSTDADPTDADLISVAQLPKVCGRTVYFRSWKRDYLHRPDDDVQKITAWGPTSGSQWVINCVDDGKVQLMSWKGDYLHRPDDDVQKITAWVPSPGSRWDIEVSNNNEILIKSWKGDYLHRPSDDVQKITAWVPSPGSRWTVYLVR